MNVAASFGLLVAGFAAGAGLLALSAWNRRRREAKVMKGYFLLGLSGLLAKVAMADGRVTGDEAELANGAFLSMKLSAAEQALCVGNFIAAQRDGLDVRDHANRFMAMANRASAECLYVLLWRLSRADGTVDPNEDRMLARIAKCLGLEDSAYEQGKRGCEPSFDRSQLVRAGVPPSVVALVC